jgi:hypothetical protein
VVPLYGRGRDVPDETMKMKQHMIYAGVAAKAISEKVRQRLSYLAKTQNHDGG